MIYFIYAILWGTSCGAITYAIQVTSSASPLWALLIPSFVSVVKHLIDFKLEYEKNKIREVE